MEERTSARHHPTLLDLRGHFHFGQRQTLGEQGLLPDSIRNIFPITDEYIILVTSQSAFLINGPNQEVLWTIFCPAREAAFDPRQERLALAVQRKIFVWDLTSGSLVQTLNLGDDVPTALAFHPQGSLLAVAPFATGVQIWRIADGQQLHAFAPDDEDYAATKSLAFSPDGQLLVTGNFESSQVWLWQLPDGKFEQEVDEQSQGGRVDGFAFSPDGQLLVCGEGGGRQGLFMRVWDMRTRQPAQGFLRKAWKPVFSSDGTLLAATGLGPEWRKGRSSRPIIVWDVATRKEIQQLIGHKDHVSHIAFSPSGRFLFASGDGRTLRCWAIESGEEWYSWGEPFVPQ